MLFWKPKQFTFVYPDIVIDTLVACFYSGVNYFNLDEPDICGVVYNPYNALVTGKNKIISNIVMIKKKSNVLNFFNLCFIVSFLLSYNDAVNRNILNMIRIYAKGPHSRTLQIHPVYQNIIHMSRPYMNIMNIEV